MVNSPRLTAAPPWPVRRPREESPWPTSPAPTARVRGRPTRHRPVPALCPGVRPCPDEQPLRPPVLPRVLLDAVGAPQADLARHRRRQPGRQHHLLPTRRVRPPRPLSGPAAPGPARQLADQDGPAGSVIGSGGTTAVGGSAHAHRPRSRRHRLRYGCASTAQPQPHGQHECPGRSSGLGAARLQQARRGRSPWRAREGGRHDHSVGSHGGARWPTSSSRPWCKRLASGSASADRSGGEPRGAGPGTDLRPMTVGTVGMWGNAAGASL
jgi:hypothetical protein